MKLQIASDLHLEMYIDEGRRLISTFDSTGVDGLVLAGDITTVTTLQKARAVFARFKERGYKWIFYVPGNHEFWKSALKDVRSRIRMAAELEGVVLLETGKPALIEGKRFLGDTMWFPDNPMNFIHQAAMDDFRIIKGFIPEVYSWNAAWRKFAANEIQQGDVVITHHVPSSKSTPEKYRFSPLNNFFVCNMEKVILQRKPALWVHGHTHTSFDYYIGATRILCNPRGYPGQKQLKQWNPKLIVEV